MRTALATVLLFACLGGSATATVDPYPFADPTHQTRFKALLLELRCLVCQNQTLSDSDADLAQDLRQQVYEMVSQGRSDTEIIDYMVARYGDFVLYRPPVKGTTYLLWAGPFLLLATGLFVLVRVVGRRAAGASSSTLKETTSATHVEIDPGKESG
jgi:cytochrome c-type biogenesis protein CcmH